MNRFAPPQAAAGPAPLPAPDLAACVERLLAFLLHWCGLHALPADPQARQLAQALRQLATLLARISAGDLPPTRAPHTPLPSEAEAQARPSARLPRCARRFLLTPGIYAGLFFTRRAAIPARARRPAPPAPLVSIFASRAASPLRAPNVPIS